MTSPYDETRRPGPEPSEPWVGGDFSRPGAGAPDPGLEPVDPWADDEARRAEEAAQDRWVSEPGGMGPIPSRTWSRGNSRIVVGGCCLPLPLGCLTTVMAAGALAAVGVARRRG